VLEGRFPELTATQPEVLAHHYTEAGLIAQAIPYWQQAGQRASQRSAHIEAISHLTKGLALLTTLPDTPARAQHELPLQIALGAPLQATKGIGAPELKNAYTRARELCRQVGKTPQLFRVVMGLSAFYYMQAEHQTARELAEQCLTLAQEERSPTRLMRAHSMLGQTLFDLGEFARALEHEEQSLALYNPQKHNPQVSGDLLDRRVLCLYYAAMALWNLGYPDQALQRSQAALTLAQELAHPFSLAFALQNITVLYELHRVAQNAREWAEVLITLCTEQGFAEFLAWGTFRRGWALAAQGQGEAGIAQMQQGLAALRAVGTEVGRTGHLADLAAAHGKVGQTKEGLTLLGEALALVDKTGERASEAELYRLKGELTLQSSVQGLASNIQAEAEAYFLKAIEIARQQQAKSLELRAAMSLSRLWQHQGKKEEARQMLAEIYGWFTEGFDTKDLQEAKALLEALT